MSSIKLKEIAHKGKGKIIGATSDSKIKGFSIDTRSIKEGNLFIALKGPYQDGHNFIKEAEKKGWPFLHKRLETLDPKSAEKIHPNDSQRIQRALEVYELSTEPMSSLQKNKKNTTILDRLT